MNWSDFSGFIPVFMMTIWLVRLMRSPHLHRHRMLAVLLASFLITAVGYFIPFLLYGKGSSAYRIYFLTVDALQWGLWVAVLTETASLVVSGYRGFTRLGNVILRVGLWISGVGFLFLWTLAPTDWIVRLVDFWTFERYVVYGSLSLLAVFFASFAAYFRLIPDHNTRVIYGVSMLVLLSNIATAAILQQGDRTVYFIMYYADILVHFIAFGAGAWLFEPAQEPVAAPSFRIHSRPAIGQLESMNETLVRLLN